MERYDQGGISIFWEPSRGEAMAALMFRAGVADEAPHRRGVTHLVEHLTLFPLGRRPYEYNAFVDLLSTVFHARGSQEEVTGFLGDVSRSLGDLPFDRFDTELEILRTEGEHDPGDFVSRMLHFRFGVSGFGVCLLKELGLRILTPDDVAARREQAFTAGNAAIWMHSPEPPELDLELPDGPRCAPPPAEPLSGLEFPAWVASGTGGVGAAMLGDRSLAMSLAVGVITERLHERLRVQEGVAYSVDAGRLPLGPDRAHILVSADCQDRSAPAVATALLEELERFAGEGPSSEELEDLNRRADRVPADDPDVIKSGLDFAATEELLGAEPLDREELARRRRAVTGEDARTALADALASRLVIVPESCPKPSAELKELERPPARFDGRTYQARQDPSNDTLIVDDAGVYWTDGAKTEISIPADELAFVTRGRGGVLRVFGVDSSWVEIDPRHITDGAEATATIVRLAGGEERVILDEPDGSAAVDELAAEQLDRAWEVGEELDVLPSTLQPGETPRSLARGARGSKSGLIVLTDRRLIFLSKRPTAEDFVELPLSDVDGAEARSNLLGNAKLRVAFEGDRIEFKGVEPKERAEEIADALDDTA
jgi:zinc protease